MYMRDFVCEQRAGAIRVYNDLIGQRTNTAKLNWLVYNVGVAMRLFNTRCLIVWFDDIMISKKSGFKPSSSQVGWLPPTQDFVPVAPKPKRKWPKPSR